MRKLTLDDLNLTGQRVLVRVDFNVPLDENGAVREFARIKAALPTIHNILDFDASAVLISHFGRPKGKRIDKYSLRPVADELSRLLREPVIFTSDCIGEEVEAMTHALKPGQVMLLENVRFHPGEEANDPEFASQLAKMGDVYINDAFGAAHRKQASLHAITKYFEDRAAAGRLMMREIRFLSMTLSNPRQPFIGIVGGAKISSKIATVKHLLPRVDKLLIGGSMAFTLIKAQGGQVGASKIDEEMLPMAKEILDGPDTDKIILPVDAIAAPNLEYGAERRTFPSNAIEPGWIGLDLGRETRAEFASVIKTAGTVFWNGPMGMFEREPYAPGTRVIARAMVELTAHGGITVVGGGDSMAALSQFQLTGPMTHISTGGGSLLEFVEGKEMPAIEALSDRKETM